MSTGDHRRSDLDVRSGRPVRHHGMVVRTLYPPESTPPSDGDAGIGGLRAHYDVDRHRPEPDRPWVGLCMVAGLDGSIAVDGRSAPLSNPTDTAVLKTLRQIADMVVVAAGTVRAEDYGRPVKAGQRIGVVTNTGRVDTSTALFTSGAGFVICPETVPELGVETLRAGETNVDLDAALRRLGEVGPEPTFVQAEGGSVLNGALAALDLVDEANLTISPQMNAGLGPRIASGPIEVTGHGFELAHLLIDDDGMLFGRWIRRGR